MTIKTFFFRTLDLAQKEIQQIFYGGVSPLEKVFSLLNKRENNHQRAFIKEKTMSHDSINITHNPKKVGSLREAPNGSIAIFEQGSGTTTLINSAVQIVEQGSALQLTALDQINFNNPEGSLQVGGQTAVSLYNNNSEDNPTSVVIGTSASSPSSPSSLLELQGTGGLTLSNVTTDQRDNLSAVEGMTLFNADTHAMEIYQSGQWVNVSNAPGDGTVTSVDATSSSSGLIITGGPVTTSGTLEFALNSELDGLSELSTEGLVMRTGEGTYTEMTLVGETGQIDIQSDMDAGTLTVSIDSAYETQLQGYVAAASDSATSAQGSASSASASATSAASSESAAQGSATAADTSAQNAASSATAADTSAQVALTSADSAQTAATDAGTSAMAASSSATAAQGAAQTAQGYAHAAQNSASEAAVSAQDASTSASDAQSASTAAQSASSGAETSAQAAENFASNAAVSAEDAQNAGANAYTSAVNADASATSSSASATTAQNAATAAQSSATAADMSATNAVSSASNAAASAQAASSSADNAGISVTMAQNAAATAETRATDADNSATEAMASATSAATLAANADASSQAAQGSANNAAGSATNAANSATTAQSAASSIAGVSSASFIVQSPNAGLPNAQALNQLAGGLLKSSANGVMSIAQPGTDYATPGLLGDLAVNGNVLSSANLNENIVLAPNGNGQVQLNNTTTVASGQKLGVGTSTPANPLHVVGTFQQKGIASGYTGTDVMRGQTALQTTSASSANILSLSVPSSPATALICRATVAAISTLPAGSAAFIEVEWGGAYYNGTTVIFLGTSQSPVIRKVPSVFNVNALWTVSGNNLVLSVTGISGTTINWVCSYEYYAVTTSTS